MDKGIFYLIGIAFVIALAAFIVYLITIIATVVAAVAATGGSLWGGGWAVLNYGKSIKENMIDSNRTGIAA